MSRLLKYKDSLDRFIKDKSCLFDTDSILNSNIETLLYNKIKESDKILAILLLTIMNNQNKKKKITLQGYYMASMIEFIVLITKFISDKNNIIKANNIDEYHKMINYLISCSNKSICQNIESTKPHINSNNIVDIFLTIMKIFNEKMSLGNILSDKKFILTNNEPNDTLKWFIKDNYDLSIKLKSLRQIEKTSFMHYLDTKICSVSAISTSVGWLIGCGDLKYVDDVIQLGKNFAIMYKLFNDFQRIEQDILTSVGYSTNYIVNYGLQNGYELFMKHKQKFIEFAMLLDTYTMTIKEIVGHIEIIVDDIIDQTSPDLKSNFSNITGFTN